MKIYALFLAGFCAMPVLKGFAQVPDKAAAIERLSREAQGFYETGRYALADIEYAHILALDPGNAFALNGEQKTEIARRAKAGAGAGQAGIRLCGDWIYPVGTWEAPVQRLGLGSDPRRNGRQKSARADNEEDQAVAEMTRRLRSIVVPTVEFRGTSRSEAIEFLRQEAKRLDPDQCGFSIFLKLPDEAAAGGSPAPEPKITMTLSNLSLLEIMRAVAAQVGMKVKIEPYAVVIVPISEQTDSLMTAVFTVAPGFFGAEAAGVSESMPSEGVVLCDRGEPKISLEKRGITFPPGSSATYLPQSGKLVVRNTKENIDMIDELLSKEPGAEPEK